MRGFPLTPTIVILSPNCWQLLSRTDCLKTAVSNLKRWRRWTTESKTTHGRVGHAATVCSCVRPQAANSCGVISLRLAEALIRTSAKWCSKYPCNFPLPHWRLPSMLNYLSNARMPVPVPNWELNCVYFLWPRAQCKMAGFEGYSGNNTPLKSCKSECEMKNVFASWGRIALASV